MHNYLVDENLSPTLARYMQSLGYDAIAVRVAQENGGVIPYDTQLDKQGLGKVARALRNHPERFAHLKQAEVLDKWVPIAERLAEEHGGVLPSRQWLEKNGYNGLRMALRRRPERFAHIPQGNWARA